MTKLPEILWQEINEPGAYVEIATGHLYRIPREALKPGFSPVIAKESREVCKLAQVSKDPAISVLHARIVCYDNGIRPNF